MNFLKKYFGLIWTILFIAVAAVIVLYPVENRDLKFVVRMEDAAVVEDIVLQWNGQEVAGVVEDDQITFEIDHAWVAKDQELTMRYHVTQNKFAVVDLTVYKDNIKINRYTGDTLIRYLADSEGFESIEYVDAQMQCVTLADTAEYTFVTEFTNLFYDMSSTFLEGRIIMLLAWIAVTLWVILGAETVGNRMAQRKSGIVSSTRPGSLVGKFVADIKKYGYYMVYSAKADLKAEVANSYLNWFWWLLEPFCNMLVYVIVFGNIMGNNVSNYPTFTFSGLLMWNFFNKSINYSVKVVRNNRDIVTKVYIPKFILLLSNMFLNLFKLLFSLIVLIGMMFVFRVPINGTIVFALLAYVEMFIFTFGLGMICLHFGVFIDDLSYAIGIGLNMMMFLSGIFYNCMTDLPNPINRLVLWCNPIAMLIDAMRDSLLNQAVPNLLIMGIWFVISIALCGIGVSIVYKNENGYVKVV